GAQAAGREGTPFVLGEDTRAWRGGLTRLNDHGRGGGAEGADLSGTGHRAVREDEPARRGGGYRFAVAVEMYHPPGAFIQRIHDFARTWPAVVRVPAGQIARPGFCPTDEVQSAAGRRRPPPDAR